MYVSVCRHGWFCMCVYVCVCDVYVIFVYTWCVYECMCMCGVGMCGMCVSEFGHIYAIAFVWRSEDNFWCWPLPFETGSLCYWLLAASFQASPVSPPTTLLEPWGYRYALVLETWTKVFTPGQALYPLNHLSPVTQTACALSFSPPHPQASHEL